MIVNSLYLGFTQKAFPTVNLYYLKYQWDLTPHGVTMLFNKYSNGYNNNFNFILFLKIFFNIFLILNTFFLKWLLTIK
jgi:hypothetical protein